MSRHYIQLRPPLNPLIQKSFLRYLLLLTYTNIDYEIYKPKLGYMQAPDDSSVYRPREVGYPDAMKQVLQWYPPPRDGIIAEIGPRIGNDTGLLAQAALQQGNTNPILFIDKNQSTIQRAEEAMQRLLQVYKTVLIDRDGSIPLDARSLAYISAPFAYQHLPQLLPESARLLRPGCTLVQVLKTREEAMEHEIVPHSSEFRQIMLGCYSTKDELFGAMQCADFHNIEIQKVSVGERTIDEAYLAGVRERTINTGLENLSKGEIERIIRSMRGSVMGEVLNLSRTVIAGVRG